MNQEKPKIYTAEFRESAVKMANESDKSIAQTARDRKYPNTWIGKYSQPVANAKVIRTDEHLYDELKRLKKEVAQLTEERNLLKSCLPGPPVPFWKLSMAFYIIIGCLNR